MDRLSTLVPIAVAAASALMTLATAGFASRRSDRSGVRRLGEFMEDSRIRQSARRGWISWSPLG